MLLKQIATWIIASMHTNKRKLTIVGEQFIALVAHSGVGTAKQLRIQMDA
jgi:hypothetical protein